MKLLERVAVVTGAGRGLGAAMARRLAEDGARVVIVDINGEDAERAAAALAQDGHEAVAEACDVSSRQQVAEVMQRTKERFGRLDILVNNAGITRDASFFKMTDDQWRTVLDVNLTSMFICTQ